MPTNNNNRDSSERIVSHCKKIENRIEWTHSNLAVHAKPRAFFFSFLFAETPFSFSRGATHDWYRGY